MMRAQAVSDLVAPARSAFGALPGTFSAKNPTSLRDPSAFDHVHERKA
jgi:hypothetical protein